MGKIGRSTYLLTESGLNTSSVAHLLFVLKCDIEYFWNANLPKYLGKCDGGFPASVVLVVVKKYKIPTHQFGEI